MNDDKKRYGFIAQELQEVIPDAVKTDENGLLSIDPLALLPFLVESLKELKAQLNEVDNRSKTVNNLEKKVDNANNIHIDAALIVYGRGPKEI